MEEVSLRGKYLLEKMMNIPVTHKDLFNDEVKAFAFLATTMDSGTPQVTPVWFDVEGEFISINSARGRVKDRNMIARSDVALAIMDPKNPYRYIQIRGKVVKITEEGGREHINRLSKKYRGEDIYPGDPEEVRVTYLIQPESFSTMG